jgi:hypothetical protein
MNIPIPLLTVPEREVRTGSQMRRMDVRLQEKKGSRAPARIWTRQGAQDHQEGQGKTAREASPLTTTIRDEWQIATPYATTSGLNA